MCVCMCMCVSVHVCVLCVCVCACERACVRACVRDYMELFRCYLCQQVFRKHTDSSHSNGIEVFISIWDNQVSDTVIISN